LKTTVNNSWKFVKQAIFVRYWLESEYKTKYRAFSAILLYTYLTWIQQ